MVLLLAVGRESKKFTQPLIPMRLYNIGRPMRLIAWVPATALFGSSLRGRLCLYSYIDPEGRMCQLMISRDRHGWTLRDASII